MTQEEILKLEQAQELILKASLAHDIDAWGEVTEYLYRLNKIIENLLNPDLKLEKEENNEEDSWADFVSFTSTNTETNNYKKLKKED